MKHIISTLIAGAALVVAIAIGWNAALADGHATLAGVNQTRLESNDLETATIHQTNHCAVYHITMRERTPMRTTHSLWRLPV